MAGRLLLVAFQGPLLQGVCGEGHRACFPLRIRGAEIPWQGMASLSSRAWKGEIIRTGDLGMKWATSLTGWGKVQWPALVKNIQIFETLSFVHLSKSSRHKSRFPFWSNVRTYRHSPLLWCHIHIMLSGALCRWLLSAPSAAIENTSQIFCLAKNGQIVVAISSPWAAPGNKISLSSRREFWHSNYCYMFSMCLVI